MLMSLYLYADFLSHLHLHGKGWLFFSSLSCATVCILVSCFLTLCYSIFSHFGQSLVFGAHCIFLRCVNGYFRQTKTFEASESYFLRHQVYIWPCRSPTALPLHHGSLYVRTVCRMSHASYYVSISKSTHALRLNSLVQDQQWLPPDACSRKARRSYGLFLLPHLDPSLYALLTPSISFLV
jgi:hypothetical protein